MRFLPLLLAAGLVLLPAPLLRGGENAPGKIFAARCANCHTVPDLDLRTDKAWLDQVNRTT